MATTIAKGRIFSVVTTVDDAMLKRMKKAPDAARASLERGAFYWHSGILPDHFTRKAHGKYGYADRTKNYLKTKGANPDLVNKGAMKQQLLQSAAAKKKYNGVELRMTARALNFAGSSDNPLDLYVKNTRSTGKGYPNMKREVRAITEDEKTLIQNFVSEELAAHFNGPK